jgi:hypothetical protein
MIFFAALFQFEHYYTYASTQKTKPVLRIERRKRANPNVEESYIYLKQEMEDQKRHKKKPKGNMLELDEDKKPTDYLNYCCDVILALS